MATAKELSLLLLTGKGNGTSAKVLAAALDTNERQVRQFISDLRDAGEPICGTPSDGYYFAATHEELEHTCDFLRSRAMHSLALESKLRRIPLTDLIGQLNLPI
jgi:biotin operon repressor